MTREEIVASVGPGWASIVNDALNKIWAIDDSVMVLDCKEKYGTLRLYLGIMSIKVFDLVYDIVRDAEGLSEKTCEQCGSPGKKRKDLPWMKTLCDMHYAEAKA
jgi:hypothetical protein